MNKEFNIIYDQVKDYDIGFKKEININDKLFLVFIRPDKKTGGKEVVFRELLK